MLGTDGIGADMLEEFRLAFAFGARRRRDRRPRPTVWDWLQAGTALVPAAADDRVTWSPNSAGTAPMDPWHLAYTPGVRPVRVEVDGEVVLDEHGPTRVDAAEIRARAREEAQRLFARMEDL